MLSRAARNYFHLCSLQQFRPRPFLNPKLFSMGYEEALAGNESRTAFRIAEKKYKLYKEKDSKPNRRRNNRRNAPSEPELATCLEGVLDFREFNHLRGDEKLPDNIIRFPCGDFDQPVYGISGYPGFFFIPEALNEERQAHFIKECLIDYTQPPNRTNHTAIYGQLSGIWNASESDMILVNKRNNNSQELSSSSNLMKEECVKERGNPRVEWEFVFNKEIEERGEKRRGREERKGERQNEEERGRGEGRGEGGEREGEMKRAGKEENMKTLNNGCSSEVVSDKVENIKQNSPNVNGNKTYFVNEHYNHHDDKIDNKNDHSNSCTEIIPAKTILRKLRWATLGIQFDWSTRSYDRNLPFRPFPEDLAELASRCALPAMPSGTTFNAEAAIINFYGPSDMLGGHVDDMEKDWSKPIVSFSLGCKAIFLLGGVSKDESPIAMFVRSGDCMLLSGHVRKCYHAVPRIFSDVEECDIPWNLRTSNASPSFLPFSHYIASSRINMNVRQVGS